MLGMAHSLLPKLRPLLSLTILRFFCLAFIVLVVCVTNVGIVASLSFLYTLLWSSLLFNLSANFKLIVKYVTDSPTYCTMSW